MIVRVRKRRSVVLKGRKGEGTHDDSERREQEESTHDGGDNRRGQKWRDHDGTIHHINKS
jgi:hypothetical protein